MDPFLTIHPDHAARLRAAGLASLGDFLAAGTVVRRRGPKVNAELRLDTDRGPLRCFLKRHAPSRRPPGRDEWRHHGIVAALGIRVPLVLAAGWGDPGSFTLTAEVTGAVPLDDLLEAAYRLPLKGERLERKRRLLTAVARIARTLHEGGWCHRDLYLCHFLAVPGEEDAPTLIDLQRIRPLGALRRRWIVKDLAALNHSAKPGIVSAADRIRFLKAYAAESLGRRALASWARRIERKTARMRRHAVHTARRNS